MTLNSMLKPLLILSLALAYSVSSQALAKADSRLQLQSISLESQHLNAQLELTVSLPLAYDSAKRYPTLYLLDGQWLLPHALSIRTDLTERNGPKRSPDFIIVAINTPNDQRWTWAMADIEAFIAFLKLELIPLIEKQYLTDDTRLVAGWEATAGAVVKMLSRSPKLFDAYVAASPTPLFGAYFPQLEAEHRAFENALLALKSQETFLFIGEAEEDYPAQYGIKSLNELLQAKAPKNLDWHYEELKGVTHADSAYYTLRSALRLFFKHSGPLEFASINEFKESGGLHYFDAFYEERAKKLKLNEDNDAKHNTRRHLSLMAIGENDIKTFHMLMTAFANAQLIERSHIPHLSAYVQFYLKHKMPTEAESIAQHMVANHPANSMAQHAMGDVMFAKSERTEALRHYRLAVKLAQQNDDWLLEVYKKNLQAIK